MTTDNNLTLIVNQDKVNEFLAKEKYKEQKKLEKKEKKKQKDSQIFAGSEGELIDNEFDRLVLKEEKDISDAASEISRLSDYRMYYDDFNNKIFCLKDEQIKRGSIRIYKKCKDLAIEHVKNHTLYNGKTSLQHVLDEIYRIFTPLLQDHTEAKSVSYAIAHWFWQVKRKMYGLEVDNHMSIGFINQGLGNDGQGAGKTTLVTNICKPFKNKYEDYLYAQIALCQMVDSKAWRDTLSRLVLFLDDISPESKHDMGIFKSIITATGKISARENYASGLSGTKNMSTPIFTANCDNFGDVIKDKTGNRRYFPIRVKSLKGRISKNFDFTQIWRMINHEWNCFVTQEMFHEIQEKHLTKTSLQLLLDQYECEPGKEQCTETKEIYPSSIKLVLNKMFPLEKQSTVQAMSKIMIHLGYKKISNGGRNKKDTVYLIKFNEKSYKLWLENFRSSEDETTSQVFSK